MYPMLPPGAQEFLYMLKNGIWSVGIVSWLFGITDRTLAALMDGYLSALDIVQLSTAALLFVSWLFLKPEGDLKISAEAPIEIPAEIPKGIDVKISD